MSPTNLYGEEWQPPTPPIVNVSPDAWSKLRQEGFTDWLGNDTRDSVNNFLEWLCERALQLAEHDGTLAFYDHDDNLNFTFVFRDHSTRVMSWWKVTFELLDERAYYYDVKRVERMD